MLAKGPGQAESLWPLFTHTEILDKPFRGRVGAGRSIKMRPASVSADFESRPEKKKGGCGETAHFMVVEPP